jgi:lysophospholipase L1-like esterase
MTARRAGLIAGVVAVSTALTVVALGLVEGTLRAAWALRNSRLEAIALPYVVDDDYGPVPPWADAARVLEPDQALLWRSRAGVERRYVDVFTPMRTEAYRVALLRRFRPSLPESLAHNPTWRIALNSQGFRSREVEVPKPRRRVRVVCLGDSWTFGANVDQDQAYPQRLEAFLRRAYPATDVEVLNLGVFGYSSFQGLTLLRRHVRAFEPDVVVIGFAMNDSRVAGFRDEDVARTAPSPVARAAPLAGRSEIVRLGRYLVASARHRPTSLAEHLKDADSRADDPRPAREKYVGTEAWTRVPLADYERNLTAMIALARDRGASVVLLFNELWSESPYRAAIERVAAAAGVPWVDSQRLIARARREMEDDVERARGLAPPPAAAHTNARGGVDVIFRVATDRQAAPRGLFIVGAHPALGALVPNRVAMFDDGTHGDQRAGDGVWSYTASLAPGQQLAYVYTVGGREGRWEGLDVPALRTVGVDAPAGRRLYRPIESFGKLYLQADAWHTDATGYELIARAVFDALKPQTARWARRTSSLATNSRIEP